MLFVPGLVNSFRLGLYFPVLRTPKCTERSLISPPFSLYVIVTKCWHRLVCFVHTNARYACNVQAYKNSRASGCRPSVKNQPSLKLYCTPLNHWCSFFLCFQSSRLLKQDCWHLVCHTAVRGVATGGISVYMPPNQSTLNVFMWLFCLLDPFIPTQIKFLATLLTAVFLL